MDCKNLYYTIFLYLTFFLAFTNANKDGWRDLSTDPTVRNCDDPNNIYLPPTATNTTQRLADLRNLMSGKGYDAYIVPSEDEHLGEYVPPRSKRRAWITGFSGSAGIAVITMTKAAVWTDGRYFLQADKQLDCNWILMRTGEPGVPSLEEWINHELTSGTVAANPFVFSIESWLYYENSFQNSQNSFSQSIPDLIDEIWVDRPPNLGTHIFIYPVEYAGKEWHEKLSDVRKAMGEAGADYLLLTNLDEIAWFFNLRGNDISTVPVFIAYSLIGQTDIVRLYANTTQLDTPELQEYFRPPGCENEKKCVETKETEKTFEDMLALPSESKVWMSSESTTYGMYSTIPPARQIQDVSPVKVPKAVKNPTEIEGMKRAHIYDAVALCEYLWWLEINVPKGEVDEISGAAKLRDLRLAQPKNKGLSFGSISASGPNAAVIHYGTSEQTNRKLTKEEIYLIDSGGQYFEGSTDVTRTVHFGSPTAFEKEAFTRVLKGMLDIELAIFPATLDGNDIDILARRYLYEVGLDFRHSTGHGIGHYLSIHEYPPGIGRVQAEGYPLQPGMFTSNEPGYYEDQKFGIRLENIVVVEKTETKYDFGGYDFLTLTPVTLVPFQKKMIDVDLLSDQQLEYINSYHKGVLKEVGEEMNSQGKSELYQWLSEVTTPIYRNNADNNKMSFLMILLSLLSWKFSL